MNFLISGGSHSIVILIFVGACCNLGNNQLVFTHVENYLEMLLRNLKTIINIIVLSCSYIMHYASS